MLRTTLSAAVMLAGAITLAVSSYGAESGDVGFTSDFNLEDCGVFVPFGSNPYFSLKPGTFLRFEGDDDGEFVELEIRVLRRVKPILFRTNGRWLLALARVVEEREWADGELVEVSRNYFARCPRSEDVFYFGEAVDIYEDGEIVSHDGAWLAGRNGAQPGLIMPGRFLLGSRYFQEVAPDVALDRAEHVESGLTIETPAGVFHDCVRIIETTPLDPDSESEKIYAPGIGLIYDDGVELVEYDH